MVDALTHQSDAASPMLSALSRFRFLEFGPSPPQVAVSALRVNEKLSLLGTVAETAFIETSLQVMTGIETWLEDARLGEFSYLANHPEDIPRHNQDCIRVLQA